MQTRATNEQLEQFFAGMPLLHSWDGGKTWNTGGGVGAYHLRAISEVLATLPDGFRVIETGAGNSTLTFLLCGANSVVSIAPDQTLFDRIKQAAEQRGIDSSALRPVVAFSEDVLPAVAATALKDNVLVDFALIDGGHGWPTVFVDFCYIMAMLKPGGYLMVDDVQLYSVKQLARLLNESNEFVLHVDVEKSIVFRKKTDKMRMTDFGGQPYIKRMTEVDRGSGKQYSLDC